MLRKIPVREHISTVLIGLGVAAVMGYYDHLRRGDVGEFVWTIILVPVLSWAWMVWRFRRKMRKQKAAGERRGPTP